MADEQPEKPTRPIGATIMIVIGVLWMVLSGLCTTVFMVGTLLEPYSYLGSPLQTVILLLVFGAFCMLPGLIIWELGKLWAGRTRKRNLLR